VKIKNFVEIADWKRQKNSRQNCGNEQPTASSGNFFVGGVASAAGDYKKGKRVFA